MGRAAEPVAVEARTTTFERVTLGCLFRVILTEDNAEARAAAGEAFAIAELINDACSPLMASAQVQAFCLKPHGEPHEVGPGFFEALERTRRLAELTEGRFDPTLGPLTALWSEARLRGRLPEADALAKAREAVGWEHLVLDAGTVSASLMKEGMRLDFGAVARGFALDKMLEKLTALGFPRVIIRAAADVRLGDPPEGSETWNLRMAVSDPAGNQEMVLPLARCGVSTVGSLTPVARIGGSGYGGLIDPATGIGVTRLASATVIAASATESAALAVAACIAGPEKTRESFAAWGARAVRMAIEDGGSPKLEVMGEFP